MLSAAQALEAAGVAGYRGVFRPTAERPLPPDPYCVYTYTRTPGWPSDDGDRCTRVRAYLHFFSRGDPEPALARLRAAMRDQGFSLIYESEGGTEDGSLYETVSEWGGIAGGA